MENNKGKVAIMIWMAIKTLEEPGGTGRLLHSVLPAARGFQRKRTPDRWHPKVLQNTESIKKTFKILKIKLIECHISGVR